MLSLQLRIYFFVFVCVFIILTCVTVFSLSVSYLGALIVHACSFWFDPQFIRSPETAALLYCAVKLWYSTISRQTVPHKCKLCFQNTQMTVHHHLNIKRLYSVRQICFFLFCFFSIQKKLCLCFFFILFFMLHLMGLHLADWLCAALSFLFHFNL